MDFTELAEYEEIRQSVRQMCSKFDDTYWQEHDENKEFHLFSQALKYEQNDKPDAE